MTINFINGEIIQALSACIDQDHLLILRNGTGAGLYTLDSVKDIISPKAKDVPTNLQAELMQYLQTKHRYIWDKKHSTAAAGVVLKRVSDGDFWFFGLEGEIMHNPKALLSIKLLSCQ